MKKLVALVLMVAYMAGAIGVTFSMHYCGGHFKGVCFTGDTEKGCCGKGEHKTNCCTDKVISAKVKDNHTATAKIITGKIFSGHTANVNPVFAGGKYISAVCAAYICNNTSPPISPGVPIYLKNRVFRI